MNETCAHNKTWKETCIECKKIWYIGVRESGQKLVDEADEKLKILERGLYVQ